MPRATTAVDDLWAELDAPDYRKPREIHSEAHVCPLCGEEKPVGMFSVNPSKGRRRQCRPCQAKAAAESYGRMVKRDREIAAAEKEKREA